MLDLYTPIQSPIHQIDARVKVLFTLAFILFVSLTPFQAWPAYILFLAIILSIALDSRLGIGFVLKRALLALPFVFAAFPLIFNGDPPNMTIPFAQGIQVTISIEGLGRFVGIALKSWISVQAAILLTATTRFPDLLTAFQRLKTPQVFTAIIGLMWRYLFVISEEVTRMLRARASRSATMPGSRHKGGTLLWRARVTGGMAGSLLLRSLERSDRVYEAMLSRGYSGELPAGEAIPLSGNDRRVLILGMCALALVWLLGLLSGG